MFSRKSSAVLNNHLNRLPVTVKVIGNFVFITPLLLVDNLRSLFCKSKLGDSTIVAPRWNN
jgi:hypothetical protein